jgi:hypothetical protein
MGCRVLTGDYLKKKSSEESKVSGGWAVTLLLLFSCLHACLDGEVYGLGSFSFRLGCHFCAEVYEDGTYRRQMHAYLYYIIHIAAWREPLLALLHRNCVGIWRG